MLSTSEYNTIEEYLLAGVHEDIVLYKRDTQNVEEWAESLAKLVLGKPVFKGMYLKEMLGASDTGSLQPVYEKYKEEINELVVEELSAQSGDTTLLELAEGYLGELWDEADPLTLYPYNQGLVAMLGLLLKAKKLYCATEQGTFTIPYSD